MLLPKNGLDVWYVDESGDEDIFVITGIAIPLLRPREEWLATVWEDYLQATKEFRRNLSRTHAIPASKELHAFKFVAGRGRFHKDDSQRFSRRACASIFRWMLSELTFLPKSSIVTVVAPTRKAAGLPKPEKIEGQDRRYQPWERALNALFQRMERASKATQTSGITFFDGTQDGYLRLYRKARRFLPTPSAYGHWAGGGK